MDGEGEQRRQAEGKRGDEVRAQLRDGMLELARRRPFRDLRVAEIAGAAGLSRSGFYFYYGDKYELLIDAARRTGELLLGQADRWWHGSGSPEERLRAALGGVAALWVEQGELLRLVNEVSTYDERIRGFWRQLVDRFIDATAEHLYAEKQSGLIDTGLDVRGAAEALMWGSERYLYVYVAGDGERAREFVELFTDLWARTLYR